MEKLDQALSQRRGEEHKIHVPGTFMFASVMGGEGLGFGLPPNVIREFVDQQAVRITFNPGAVLSPPTPIEVEVEPVLVAPGKLRGEVRLEGDDIATVTVPLTAVPTGLSGTIDVPDRIAGLARPERYFVTISLTSAGNLQPLVRRFALDAVPESFQTLTSEREPGRMMEDRKLPTDEMAIEDYAKSKPVAAGEGRRSTLADAARNIKLQRDSSGAVVVDNQAVKQIAGPKFDPKRYALLPDDGLRALAERFDRLDDECQRLETEQKHLAATPGYWRFEIELNRSLSEARSQRSDAARQLQQRGVAVCTDDPLYFVRSSYEFARDYPCVNYKWIQ